MKKVFVKKDDYDLYSIRVPLNLVSRLKLLSRRRRRVFIARELEKIHPNFSASSIEDTRFGVGKNGLFASVAVMDRDKFSEYRLGFPNSRLFLESKPSRSVFDKKNDRKRTLVLIAIGTVAFGALKLCDHFLSKCESENNMTAVVESSDMAASAALLAPQELFVAVLASVREKEGRVTNLSWKNGKCSFSVTGCNSEDIVGAKYCVVSYSSGKPQFNFVSQVNDWKMSPKATIPANITADGLLQSSFCKISNIVPSLRSVVLLHGADVLSEKVGRDESIFSFICEYEKLSVILSEISNLVRESGWCETSVSMDCDSRFVSSAISFKNLGGEIAPFDTPLSVLSVYADVFFPKVEIPSTEDYVESCSKNYISIPSYEKSSTECSSADSRVRIGEIKKNGSSFIFYRGRDGRIEREVKDAI